MKFLLVSCFVLFALQGTTQAVSIQTKAGAWDDLNGKIQKLIDDFKNSANNIISTIRDAIDQLQQALPGFAEEIVKEIDDALAKLQVDVNNIAQEAKETAAQLVDCVQQHAGELGDLSEELQKQTRECVEKQTQEALRIIQAIKDDVSNLKDQAVKIFQKLSNCGANPICIIGVVGEITNLINDAKAKVGAHIEEVKGLLQSIVTEAQPCIEQAATEVGGQELEVVNEIKLCMNTVIHG